MLTCQGKIFQNDEDDLLGQFPPIAFGVTRFFCLRIRSSHHQDYLRSLMEAMIKFLVCFRSPFFFW